MLTASYSSLWVACATSGILVPVPEDLPLVWAGIQVGDGVWSAAPTVLVALLGVACRDLLAWSAGRVFGAVLLDEGRGRVWMGRKNVAWARGIVDRHGASAVLMGRFFVGFRAPVFAVAGAMGVPLRLFVLYDGVGLLIAVPLAVSLGYAFGHPVLALLVAALAWARTWLVPLTLVGLAVTLATLQWRRSASRRQAAEKVS